ncbi:MAG: YjbF family lipoprotein [Aestuariibacter sp.]
MDKRILIVTWLIGCFLSGCTGTYVTHYENLKLAFADPVDPSPSLDVVRESPVDLALVKIGDTVHARIALAYQENGIDKWISADKAMLAIKDGHIIKTHSFKNDLIYVSETEMMPLANINKVSSIQWRRNVDWESGEYGHVIESTFQRSNENESIEILGKLFTTIVVVERAEYLSPSKHTKWNRSWENTFWFDKDSGELLQSSQQTSPFSKRIDMQYISRAVRLM